jgi:hypothetical protein
VFGSSKWRQDEIIRKERLLSEEKSQEIVQLRLQLQDALGWPLLSCSWLRAATVEKSKMKLAADSPEVVCRRHFDLDDSADVFAAFEGQPPNELDGAALRLTLSAQTRNALLLIKVPQVQLI